MYEIVKTFLSTTSSGGIIAYLDKDKDLHIMSDDFDIKKEVQDKYNRREKCDVI